ncbi:MAG: bifunctional methylenetetrahydrofolate dehydrogenase/methenyltetrahydrofolate cyclohydrolase FolD [Oscillospiraceae bacterium]
MGIIDGRLIASQVKEQSKADVEKLVKQGITPGLAVILVGGDPASQVYVRNKGKACVELGMYAEQHNLPEDTTEEQLLDLIEELNNKKIIHGILVQLPLPKHIDEKLVINAIAPEKDVDCFHPTNVGKVMTGHADILPCTPAGIIRLIQSTGSEIAGKDCVVIGRSDIVGKPTAILMLHQNATVTLCHSQTKNLAKICHRADILISAVGVRNIVTKDMVKPGAIVIDVGMNHDENGKLCGDVDFANVKDVAGFITPVPGGVGPMTIQMLMKNTIDAAKQYNKSLFSKSYKK